MFGMICRPCIEIGGRSERCGSLDPGCVPLLDRNAPRDSAAVLRAGGDTPRFCKKAPNESAAEGLDRLAASATPAGPRFAFMKDARLSAAPDGR